MEEMDADSSDSDSETEVASDAAIAVSPTRRELDPAIKDLLREEREREEDLRRGGTADPIESQEEMALNRPSRPEPAIDPEDEDDDTDTLAALRAATAGGGAAGGTAARLGRDLLPDIEEINSTLRATSDRNAQDFDTSDVDSMDVRPRRRRGFRFGFLLMLLLAAIAVLAYAYSAEIIEAMPQSEGPLTHYVAWVDGLRLWLDGIVQNLAERLNSSASEG